ncbi:Na/H antiporter-like protein [Leishmania infantum JPCM5]|uniref:Na/H_antiporter-like_protein n=2 Tax=Leishmania infantum TaxID=5671 RepID=A0A6L0XPQ1_LEIIN|nr:Na/H antiporter-like protein [Leishmania infantum JPCM5]CAC9489576.1 Na/H_antiporter-like_protein [Leishmania infantum]CAM68202.1 Na/H antiporter-like protein [Leishmania infantum JPCM5]SUZ41973.1 Na/H_antiporter-like_protein [Leishmania infantum]|eukprot:XP_001465775.1 Na/H antiporter-like protein [Leishmania infantum JPCM5]
MTHMATPLEAASSSRGTGEGACRNTESFERLSLVILFVTMLIFLGGTFFMTHKRRIPLPYTVVLFLYGIAVGVVARWLYPDVAEALGSIPPELLFYIFLPVLIFEGSYAMNIHALRRVFPQVALLATVGVLINTALLAVPVKLFFQTWSWYTALLLGSLLSATDPVAVVALLKELGVDKCMTAMVDGEAVMNDGTAIILFTLLLPAARVGFVDMSPGVIVVRCIWLALLPIALGPLFGFLQSFWLRRTSDGLTKACITVSVTYVSYYVAAELLGTSGVLTLFFQGIFLSYYCPSLFPGREGNIISSAWEFLVHLGNTVLFSLVGVILVADVLPTVKLLDIFVLVALYIAMMLSRLLMLEVLSPVLNMFSYKFDQKRIALMVHAGLRGGVAATLAIAVMQEGLEEGVDILKVTSGIVLLTLLVNASTSATVVERLGFKTKSEYRIVKMEYAMELMRSSQEHALEGLKRDIKYRNASWMQVEKFVQHYIRNPFRNTAVEPEEDEEKMVNRMLMSAFKTALWLQRDKEVITETVVVQMGASLATLIERGELLDVQQMYWYHRHRGASSGEEERAIVARVSPPRGRRHSSNMSTPSSHYSTQQPQQLATTQPWRMRPSTDVTVEGEAVAVPESLEEMQNRPSGVPSATGASQPVGGPSVRASGSDEHGGLALGVTSLPSHYLGGDAADEGEKKAETNRMVNNLMRRLLPAWVVLVERFICSPGYFAAAHRRAQENAFVALLAVVKCLNAISPLKFKFIRSEAQARRVERWMTTQIAAANRAIRFFYTNFPEATNNVASSRAVVSVANALEETVHNLNAEHGFGTRATEELEKMVACMRSHTPSTWENNASQNESNLVLRAVAATPLGKGLRSLEIKAISSMGLVRKFREGDIITLPDNAFLVVVFGSLRAVYGQWTTLTEHEQMESFGDTVGLEALMLPQEFRVDQQRRWRVISTDSTALIISFNSIKPFLTERSLRAVKALWRAAAAEVLMPFLSRIVTVPDNEARTKREHLMELIMAGTPLIGPRDCDLASCETNFHLYFYLRGYDKSGLFNCHTPPCYISIFYVHQLRWVDPDAVLYAVPMRVGDRGYVPWPTTATTAGASGEDEREDESSFEEAEEFEGVGASARRTSPSLWTAVGRSPAAVCPSVSLQPPLPAARSRCRATVDELLPVIGQSASAWGCEVGRSHHNDAHDSMEPNLVHSSMDHSDRGGGAGALFTRNMEPDGVTPPALFGENSVATHAGATNIINSVLLGCAPEDPDELGLNASISAFGDLLDNVASPTPTHTGCDLFLRSPSVSERLGHSSASHFIRDTDISIFYALEGFATQVPFVNQMLVHYASSMEHLCIATLRYLRFPTDPFHARHAQSTGEQTVEFLLNFCVELSMLKRTCRIVSKWHSEDTEVLHPFHVSNDADSAFQARVCGWARRHRLNGKFHLKTMVTEMNQYANRRFPDYVSVLRRMVELEPGLKEVETAEGMNSMCRRILKSSKGVAVEMESLEDAI